jgi:glycosyltransferase involved in cell wall biosynthesis
MTDSRIASPGTGVLAHHRIAFVSTMFGDPWGGSEELWWEAAMRMRKAGISVSACLRALPPRHSKIQQLMDADVVVLQQHPTVPIWRRALRYLMRKRTTPAGLELEAWLSKQRPTLVVLNAHFVAPEPEVMDILIRNDLPFITILHANADHFWPSDEEAQIVRSYMDQAQKNYFVSQANMRLMNRQYGLDISKAQVLRNPYAVDPASSSPWPSDHMAKRLNMACVGRLAPGAKGQDLLIQALSQPQWQDRNWRLNVYGQGPFKNVLERLVADCKLEDHIWFLGHASISDIWAENHVLVQPSRMEGLPITIVEALMSARPVVTTDVGGNAELLIDGETGFVADAPTVASVALALERMWARRSDLKKMGEAAAVSVREQIPADPVDDFMQELSRVAEAIPSRTK